MTVSVALATYNGGRFLFEQLESIRNQSVLPMELVICDDASDDDTLVIASRFAETAPFPVRIERNERRLHYADNFLKAALLCKGRYVSFCDQDDIWLPTKIERSIAALERSGALLCVHNRILIDEKGAALGEALPKPGDRIFTGADLDPWDVYPGYACTFLRALLDKMPSEQRAIDMILPHHKSAHDRWIYFLAATFGTVIELVEPLVLYRQHDDNTYGHRDRKLVAQFRKVRDKYVDYIRIREQISTVNSRLLRDYAPQPEEAERVQAARKRWGDIAEEFSGRAAVFAHGNRLRRMAALATCARSGRYVRSPERNIRRAIAEDLIGALVARPVHSTQSSPISR